MKQNQILNIFLDNIQKIFYPEEWIDIDLKLSKTELFTMFIVDRQGEVTMGTISNKINISMSTATGIVDRLVNKEYLKRERSESDRRVVVIKLTEDGMKILGEIKNTFNYYIDTVYESLTDEEIKVLSKIVLRVIDVFNSKVKEKDTKEEKEQIIKKISIE